MSINDLVHNALDKLEEAVVADKMGTAVVYFDTDEKPYVMTDETYWANPNTMVSFEDRAARHGREFNCTRFAFAIAAVVAQTDDGVWMRPPNVTIPLADHETEVMYVVACDLEAGIEIGRVDIIRDEDGGVGFGELYLLQGRTQFEDVAPGFRIVKALAA